MAQSIDSVPAQVTIPTVATVSNLQFNNEERSMHRSVIDSTLSEQESNSQQHDVEKEQNLVPMMEYILPPAEKSPRQRNLSQIRSF